MSEDVSSVTVGGVKVDLDSTWRLTRSVARKGLELPIGTDVVVASIEKGFAPNGKEKPKTTWNTTIYASASGPKSGRLTVPLGWLVKFSDKQREKKEK